MQCTPWTPQYAIVLRTGNWCVLRLHYSSRNFQWPWGAEGLGLYSPLDFGPRDQETKISTRTCGARICLPDHTFSMSFLYKCACVDSVRSLRYNDVYCFIHSWAKLPMTITIQHEQSVIVNSKQALNAFRILIQATNLSNKFKLNVRWTFTFQRGVHETISREVIFIQ